MKNALQTQEIYSILNVLFAFFASSGNLSLRNLSQERNEEGNNSKKCKQREQKFEEEEIYYTTTLSV